MNRKYRFLVTYRYLSYGISHESFEWFKTLEEVNLWLKEETIYVDGFEIDEVIEIIESKKIKL